MKRFSARGVISACAVTAACAAAAAAPTAASAFEPSEQCSGANIEGRGSSAQKIIQKEYWDPDYNTSANAKACNGTQGEDVKPTVKYESIGSGAGLESWGVETNKTGSFKILFGPNNAFIGTEIAPNEKQEEEIESHGPPGEKVLTIPVAQPAIAIIFHLPTGCKLEGGPVPGRIAVTQSTLEKIFDAYKKDVEWKEILNGAKFGNLHGKKKECKGSKDKITRVVREDGSGTTDSFKKFLGEIEPGKVYENAKKETWDENGEKTANTEWPHEGATEHPVLRGNGGGGLVKKVAENAGTIGYANLADARANAAFKPAPGGTGGSETETFWAEVENSPGHYEEPSTNGEADATANSNCAEVTYTNGSHTFPPPSTEELWNHVVESRTDTDYAPCYITYDLSLTSYEGFEKETFKEGTAFVEPTTEAEALGVSNFLSFELATETVPGEGPGGQNLAEGHDYIGDATSSKPEDNVLKIAREGVAKINYE